MCKICDQSVGSGLSRRGLFAGLTAGIAINATPARSADPVKPALTPDAALQQLMAGHAKYLAGRASVGNYAAGRAGRAGGQSPIAAILSCADSRVLPELIFNQGPGDLFVVRVAGNVENADGLASLEYGTAILGIPLIMVMGHSNCGAVAAAIKVHREKTVLPGHLPGLIDLILPSVRKAEAMRPADLLAVATIENVRGTAATVAASDPVIAASVKAGTAKVVGSVYDVATGKVTLI